VDRAALADLGVKEALAGEVRRWVDDNVARHKRLRGGVIVVDGIPKRYVGTRPYSSERRSHTFSAAGKILRKELRAAAAAELS
jgi:4-coumarate--CoA ligase